MNYRILCVVVLCSATLFAQEPSPDPLKDVRESLNQLSQALSQTQAELGEARAEIKALREQVKQLQSATPPAATAADDKTAALQEAQDLLASRVEQHEQEKVESESKYKLKIGGMVLFNSGFNRGEVDNSDVPSLALFPKPGTPAGSVFGTMRQSIVGLQMIGPKIGGARTAAEVQFDFYGGFQEELDGVAMGLVRLRTGSVNFNWDRWSLRLAQDAPFISPQTPTSIASLGVPSLGFSGNLWTWTPQIVGERRWKTGENSTAALKFGIMDPFDGEEPHDSDRQPEAGERSRRPAFSVHQSWKRTVGNSALELGAGAYVAQQNYGVQGKFTSWAGTLDWKVPLTHMFEISGEVFRGQAVGGLWGAIGQSAALRDCSNFTGYCAFPIRALGGWTQLKFAPSSRLEFNGVFGIDNPFARDLRGAEVGEYDPVLQNRTAMFNVIGHLRSNLLISLEYRHLRTGFETTSRTAEHVNLGVGVQF